MAVFCDFENIALGVRDARYDKFDIKRVTDTCSDYYQTCQESWHPNAAGQQVLGQCLSGAWTGPRVNVSCVRSASGVVLIQ